MAVSNLLRLVFASIFIAATSAVFAISFAAIIYSGDLAEFFGRGIGLTLLGATVLAITGALTLSYRGTMMQPQDVPAILLAGGAANLVAHNELSGEVLFATVACLASVASLATGLVAILVGQLRLAMLARFIPYPVLAGFLAATGLLLLIGGIGVAVGMSPDAGNISEFFEREAMLKWAPVCVAAGGIVIATRMIPSHLTLPVALVITAIFFYVSIATLGLTWTEARSAGFLLGPFQSGSFLTGLGPQIAGQADWFAILGQVPVIVTIIAISLIGATLNASGLELETGMDLDINKDVRGVGIGNTLSALVGGLPGYHLLGETILALRLGLTGPVAGISGALGCIFVLFMGGTLLSLMPTGLFAAIITFLGIDLLYTWLWAERRNLKLRDYAIVVCIPIIAVTLSFLMAIAAGLVVAFCFFVITYAKLGVIRSRSSVAVRRSFVERPDDQLNVLAQTGSKAQIVELSGYLFFASANVLREHAQAMISDGQDDTEWLILDFKHVSGIDISTWHMLQRLTKFCDQRGVHVIVSGLDHIDEENKAPTSQSLRYKTLDQALEYVEDALLADTASTSDDDIFAELAAIFPLGMFEKFVETVSADSGDVVIESGSKSEDIYVLKSGQMAVSVTKETGNVGIVAQIRPGSVIGEMAYYTGRARSADIIADGTAELLRIDMKRLAEMEKAHPGVASKFHKLIARHMARRLSRTTMLLRDLGF